MNHKFQFRELRQRVTLSACIFALLFNPIAASARTPNPGNDAAAKHHATETPIKHLVVLIGENRTFDHLFATYVSPSGDSVKNLLSEHIIRADGTPGKDFSKAAQFQAIAPFKTTYYISLDNNEKAPYEILPEPSLNFSPSPSRESRLHFPQYAQVRRCPQPARLCLRSKKSSRLWQRAICIC